ncbi:MAG: polynucleotide kinase-phosphatase, partial [Actinomycetia bacterium]|nr:polynucleotide kinase-phosphatase [Actinomycetes bacterium]
LPVGVCLERNASRVDRRTPDHAIRRQHRNMGRTIKRLKRERFARVHTLRSGDEVDGVTVEREPVWNDRRDDVGPFDIIGDVHGCHEELIQLLAELGYDVSADVVSHPAGRRVVFLGDLVDRGPGVAEVLDLAMTMVEAGTALCILGNHENKLSRALAGRNVQITHGLAESLAQLEGRSAEYRQQVKTFLDGLISHYVLDGGRLIVAHAGLPERYHGRTSGRVRSIALYGDTSGETDDYGLPVRYPWADDYQGKAAVVYGHTPVPTAEWVNNTICLDTGSVFGGELSALRWPERELVSVPAGQEYYAPTRPLATEPARGRPLRLLDVDDVLGKQFVETTLAGRLAIEVERSSAALEVMSRFAVDPRWLMYLPPTMAPVGTSDRPDYLEHPDEAFAYYRNAGVGTVVGQEKHMGSRAVLVVAKDTETAAERFGITNDAAGVVVTRTGRPFFADGEVTRALLDRVRPAIGAAGWWESLATGWVVLDAEILPWSAKATDLLRRQYAATGAAGRAELVVAEQLLAEALGSGVDADALGELASRTTRRRDHVGSYVDAYRRYCWAVEGLDGVEIAPFQVLAAEGEVLARRSHRWHLEQIDALVGHDDGFLRRTDRREIDLGNETQVEEATQWWTEMTNAGGEGMVVKPAEPILKGERGLVLPGVKCRGREYLRIIYGPEYLEPANLDRLRSRSLGRKSSLARREFALGIEALDRFVANEHLHRVHECVFGVLALESEPVDPRL